MRPLSEYTLEELQGEFAVWGFKEGHAAAVLRAHYAQDPGNPLEGLLLPKALAERLRGADPGAASSLSARQEASDGTCKLLVRLGDGRTVEAVMMPDYRADRAAGCVSTQVGCAMGCVFCATGQMGYRRHLTAAEIVAQVVHVARSLAGGEGGGRLRNVVFMGMGEPLHNYDAVMRASDILRDPSGLALSAERITLSTVGVVPGIRRMADEASPIHLAVSLHAANQAERAALVPAARKWPLDELMDACRHFSETLGRRIFFEWTLIEGRNDTERHAHEVGRLIGRLPAQVNLIPLNPTAGYGGSPTRSEAARRFQHVLTEDYGIPSTVRQRRGIDIAAGCGQLAAPVSRTAPSGPGS